MDHIKSLDPPGIVHPILTPRFAISCSSPLLAGLGEIAAADPDLAIQTHISENAAEIAFTRQLFPDCSSYAGVYDNFGLLRNKTILAHGCHLSDDELELIRSRGAGISHCPTSNLNLRSGIANVGGMLDRGIKVGLGTDVSGGYSPSMLTAMQHASICSKILSQRATADPSSPLSFTSRQLPLATLLYLATMGGAEVCGLAGVVGNFLPGKQFDGLLVDMRDNDGVQDESRTLLQLLEKFLFCGDDRSISLVWVKNTLVGGHDHGRRKPA